MAIVTQRADPTRRDGPSWYFTTRNSASIHDSSSLYDIACSHDACSEHHIHANRQHTLLYSLSQVMVRLSRPLLWLLCFWIKADTSSNSPELRVRSLLSFDFWSLSCFSISLCRHGIRRSSAAEGRRDGSGCFHKLNQGTISGAQGKRREGGCQKAGVTGQADSNQTDGSKYCFGVGKGRMHRLLEAGRDRSR